MDDLIAQNTQALEKIDNLRKAAARQNAEERLLAIQISILEEAFVHVEGLGVMGSEPDDICEFRKNAETELKNMKVDIDIDEQMADDDAFKYLALMEEVSDLLDKETTALNDKEKLLTQHSEFVTKVLNILEPQLIYSSVTPASGRLINRQRDHHISSRVASFLVSRGNNMLPTSTQLIMMHPAEITGKINKRSDGVMKEAQTSSRGNLSPIFHRSKLTAIEYFESVFHDRVKSNQSIRNKIHQRWSSVSSLHYIPPNTNRNKSVHNIQSHHGSQKQAKYQVTGNTQIGKYYQKHRNNLSMDMQKGKVSGKRYLLNDSVNDSSDIAIESQSGKIKLNTSQRPSVYKAPFHPSTKSVKITNHIKLIPVKQPKRLSVKLDSKADESLDFQPLPPLNKRQESPSPEKISKIEPVKINASTRELDNKTPADVDNMSSIDDVIENKLDNDGESSDGQLNVSDVESISTYRKPMD